MSPRIHPHHRLALAALASLLGAGCVTTNVSVSGGQGTTIITTVPSGAQVYINGREVCATTPCNWNEGDGLAHRYHLQVRKEGYQEVDLYLDKELQFFNAFFSVITYQMPRQVALTLEASKDGQPAPEGPPAPPAPSL